MITSDYLSFSWEELITTARHSLKHGDVEQLRQLDAVFHYRFFTQVRRGTAPGKDEFVRHMLRLTESPEARSIAAPAELQRVLCGWRHLEVLLGTLRADGDLVDEAERLVQSRRHASELLDAITGATGWGIQAGELARQLCISPQHLATLLREFEQHDIVDRHKVGKHVYVCPGLVGQLVSDRRQAAKPRLVSSPPARLETQATRPDISFGNDACIPEPLSELRQLLSAA